MPKVEWAENGVDPTRQEYPLEGPSLQGCVSKIGIVVLLILAGFGIYGITRQPPAAPLPTLAALPSETATEPPTATSTETATEPPTATSTITPSGTWTEIPTYTPTRTSTPTATYTATPIPEGVIASWTPGPWMLTNYASTFMARYATTTPSYTPTVPTATPTNTPTENQRQVIPPAWASQQPSRMPTLTRVPPTARPTATRRLKGVISSFGAISSPVPGG